MCTRKLICVCSSSCRHKWLYEFITEWEKTLTWIHICILWPQFSNCAHVATILWPQLNFFLTMSCLRLRSTSTGPSIISFSEMGSHERNQRGCDFGLLQTSWINKFIKCFYPMCLTIFVPFITSHTQQVTMQVSSQIIRIRSGLSVFLSDTCGEEEGHQGGIEPPNMLIRSWPVFLSKLFLFSVGILWAACSVFWLNMFTFDNS